MNPRSVIPSAIATCALFFLCCCGGMLFDRDELLDTFSVGPHTINIYAEPNFFYEPPGYIDFELEQWGQTRVSKRRFMGIGPARKPQQSFTLITSDDDEVVALLLNNDVQMIHEFSSGFTWPGPYTNVTEPQWQTAELLLQKLRDTDHTIRCSRQVQYRKELDLHP